MCWWSITCARKWITNKWPRTNDTGLLAEDFVCYFFCPLFPIKSVLHTVHKQKRCKLEIYMTALGSIFTPPQPSQWFLECSQHDEADNYGLESTALSPINPRSWPLHLGHNNYNGEGKGSELQSWLVPNDDICLCSSSSLLYVKSKTSTVYMYRTTIVVTWSVCKPFFISSVVFSSGCTVSITRGSNCYYLFLLVSGSLFLIPYSWSVVPRALSPVLCLLFLVFVPCPLHLVPYSLSLVLCPSSSVPCPWSLILVSLFFVFCPMCFAPCALPHVLWLWPYAPWPLYITPYPLSLVLCISSFLPCPSSLVPCSLSLVPAPLSLVLCLLSLLLFFLSLVPWNWYFKLVLFLVSFPYPCRP